MGNMGGGLWKGKKGTGHLWKGKRVDVMIWEWKFMGGRDGLALGFFGILFSCCCCFCCCFERIPPFV